MNIRAPFSLATAIFASFLVGCAHEKEAPKSDTVQTTSSSPLNGGFESQLKWGEHLVTIGLCNDCHTPRKMTPSGPVLDMSLMLSGHPANIPIDIDRKVIESKPGYTVRFMSAWVGPWGVSYAANLTPDETGLGAWKETQFFKVMREGKYKGLDGSRAILPPMPWDMYRNMTDDELRAIFA